MSGRLTIVIVHFNTKDYLRRCLRSMVDNRGADYRIVVVDNASDDNDFSSLKLEFPLTSFILNSDNLGFAAACNIGIRAFPASFYLLLNPDCEIQGTAVDQCLEYLEGHPEIGVLGCRVENPDGSLQLACRRRVPGPAAALYRFTGLSLLFPKSRRFGAYNMTYLDEREIAEVDSVSGSFLLFRDPVLKTGGPLDESFFLYGEDMDFCYRAKQAGWKIVFYPRARVLHHKRRSAAKNPDASLRAYYQAMEVFYRKHQGRTANALQRAAIIGGIRLLYSLQKLRGKLFGKRGAGSSV